MREARASKSGWLLPVAVAAVGLAVWAGIAGLKIFLPSVFPPPLAVAAGFVEEVRSGRWVHDLIASLFRVSWGFLLAAVTSIPLGLWLGRHLRARTALLPTVNFFRNLSPLAWIPFSLLWFGIGDAPAIFLVFMASFFPLLLAVIAAVANIPAVHFQVARDYGFKGPELLYRVTLPAIMPQVITALRVTAGVAWMVIVAAEMIGVKAGLGYAIWDARNGLRSDLLVSAMISIGVVGVL
ncbi:MAG TPA: ABC transporter permease, partial [Armatimonadota bacterium]|nr:ABC transporter permease [Armatimonadota bacterium]